MDSVNSKKIYMMWNSWGNMWGGGFGFGWIFMLVFWGLIIWGIFGLVCGATGHSCCGHHGEHKQGEKTPLAELTIPLKNLPVSR